MGIINMTTLAAELSKIRNVGNHDREDCKTKVLHCLKYADDTSVSIPDFDAFLIRVVSERFGVSANRDIVLMDFGLLEGYHYEEIDEIEDRRDKYLTDSNHQQTRARKKESYVGASDKRKKAIRDNLRKMEDGLIQSLAHYIYEQVKNDNSNDIIKEYIKSRVSPISLPQPIYILSEGGTKSALTAEEMHIDIPQDAGKQGGLEKEPPFDEPKLSEKIPPDDESKTSPQPPPQQTPIHISSDTINNGTINNGTIKHVNVVVKTDPHINIHRRRQVIPIFVIIVVAVVGLVYSKLFRPTFPPVDEILVTDSEIELVPNEQRELGTAVLPPKASGVQLSYISSDPSIVRVSPSGMLQAAESHMSGGVQTADITIQAESGATKVKTVTVNFSESGYDTPEADIDDFVPDYRVEQRVRLAGTDEWLHSIEDAKIGDKIEFRIQYKNVSANTQHDVMIRNVLPKNLAYLPGTTRLTNAAYKLAIVQDDIVTDGINIGNYMPGANALVDFTAVIVDQTLQMGSNTLVNWSQCGVGQVTLQDYATVQLYIDK